MNYRNILLLIVIFAAVLLAVTPSWVHAAPVEIEIGSTGAQNTPEIQAQHPGNYCISCHLPDDERLEVGAAWVGGIAGQAFSPCPASARIQEELYYTERLLLAIDRSRSGLPAGPEVDKADVQLGAALQTYSRLQDTPISSLEAFVSEAQTLRFRAGKIYTQLNQVHENQKIRNLLLAAGSASLFILLSLAWGFKNIQSIHKIGQVTPVRAGQHLSAVRIVLLAGIMGIFSLPIFRTPSAEVVSASREEQASQTALDTAQRTASAADRALARAWMLARVGAAQHLTNVEGSQAALDESLAAARQAQMDGAALWGSAQAGYEVNTGSPAGLEKAYLAGIRLDAARSRAWGLRMIAAEWASVDPIRAQSILDDALAVSLAAPADYRDLDLRAIAVAYAAHDFQRGLDISILIGDPALRSWALREIADLAPVGDESAAVYSLAAAAARLVEAPTQRARLLGEIASHTSNPTLYQEAVTSLAGLDGAGLAYTLSYLAALSGDPALVENIQAGYPGARAYAYYRLGLYEQAWQAALLIPDPYERAQAQAAIAPAWENPVAARTIEIPTLQDRAFRDLVRATSDNSLAAGINSGYYQVQAYTHLGDLHSARESAADLKDGYPLIELGRALAKQDAQAALELIDLMEREADKALVLLALAAASGDEVLFERALGMSLAARVRGDPLSPVQVSLDLALALSGSYPSLSETALTQALETARRISIK